MPIPPLRRAANDKQRRLAVCRAQGHQSERALTRTRLRARDAGPPPQLRVVLPSWAATDQRRGRAAGEGSGRLPLPGDRDRRGAGPGRHRLRHRGRARPAPARRLLRPDERRAEGRDDGTGAARGARLRRRRRAPDRRHPSGPRPLRRAARLPRGRGARPLDRARRGPPPRAQGQAALPRRALATRAALGQARSRWRRAGSASRASASCPASTPRCCWSPSSATRAVTPAWRCDSGDGWLLHCGDAYFDHGEVETPPSCPPGLRLFQNLNAADGRARKSQPGAPARAGRRATAKRSPCSAPTTRTSWSASRQGPPPRPRPGDRAASPKSSGSRRPSWSSARA